MKYIAISQPGGPEVLQIREGEIPTIGEHEVLIEVKAAGVNRPDILQRQGLCHALGMTVYATVGQDEKSAALRPYATAINYKTDDFAEKIGQLTNDEGVDVILDIVGGPYFNRNLGLLKKDGRLVIIGFMGGRIAHEVDIQTLMLKRATVTGSTMRGRTAAEKQQIAEALRRHVWPLLEAGKCKPLIYASYPMAEIAEAHACLDSGQHLGKVVITMTS